MGLVGLWGQPLAQLTLLQLWPWDGYLSCQAHIVARTPSTRCLHLCLSFQLGSTTWNCSLPSWHPAMTGCIQLGSCKHVGQGIIVHVDIKGWPIQVFMEFWGYCPLEGKKLVCWVVGLSLAQAPTGIGYYSICAILTGLVENSSQTRPTGISVELEWSGEICIGMVAHSLFRSSEACWHLLSYWMAAFFLPAFSPEV